MDESKKEEDGVLLYVTFENRENAKELISELLDKKLIACANLFGGVESHYSFKGKLCQDTEVVVIFKTVQRLAHEVMSFIEDNHNYDTPCVFTLPMGKVSEPFYDWLKGSVE